MKQERLSKQSKVNRLDLGLSSILSSFSETAESSPTAHASGAQNSSSQPNFILVSEPASAVPPAPPPREKSAYENLAQSERWPELAQLCESKLSLNKNGAAAETQDVIEARLWWIKSQLINGGVPMSILAAPLESVSTSILELHQASDTPGPREKSLVEFCAQLLMDVAGQLQHNSEPVLALTFLERAYKLDKSCGPKLRTAIERELERLKKNPRADRDAKIKAKISRLTDLLHSLKLIKAEPEAVVEAAQAKNSTAASSEISGSVAQRSTFRLSRAAVVALILVVSSAAAWYTLFGRTPGREGAVASTSVVAFRQPTTVLAELPRVSGLSNLDALYYDIDGASVPKRQADSDGSPGPVAASQVAAAVDRSANATMKQAKVQIDTSGPVEGAEFENLAEEDVGHDNSRRDELFSGASSRSQGDPLVGVPVEKFDSDKLFLVLTKTNVMARPSFHTAALAELESGDKVLVESKVGPWLKLRSKHGQAGYILAQDAELTTKRAQN